MLIVLCSTSCVQCHEGSVVAHAERLAGIGQLPSPPTHTTELPLQIDRQLRNGGQHSKYTKPVIHQVCYECAIIIVGPALLKFIAVQ